jgi:prevent-host-death family protein
MMPMMNPKKVLNSFIPITRFNRGEASKIINEVKTEGVKFIVKNNNPECVLLSVEDYKKMLDEIEDAELAAMALEREALHGNEPTIPFEQVMKEAGITQADLDAIDDSEIEFE